MKTFNPLTCPLSGSNLLEASAGTGKTFSLMLLYLRLLLEKELSVKDIVVATFTNAAKAEIRQRIEAQLQELSQFVDTLQSEVSVSQDNVVECLQQVRLTSRDKDSPLWDLLENVLIKGDDKAMPLTHVVQRLRLARSQFDYAQIYSIDGFAGQLLRENHDVLASYVPDEVVPDDAERVQAIYLSLAKHNFSPLAAADDIAKAVASRPYDELINLLTAMVTHLPWLQNSNDNVVAATQKKLALLDDIVAADHSEALAAIRTAIEQKQLDGRTYKMASLDNYARSLDHVEQLLTQSPAFWRFFSRRQLLEKSKVPDADFDYPLCRWFDDMAAEQPYLIDADSLFFYQQMLRLATAVAERLPDEKAADMVMTFADVTHVVAENAHRIQTPIQAALIDEAQDTNREQLKLFETLFLRDDKISFFVGDPKQAIYGFRGANIYSYLDIQSAVDNHYVLATNYRSSAALNDSINTFFSGTQPFLDERIGYLPIAFHLGNEQSDFGDCSLSLITANDASVQGLADCGAEQIAALLQSDKRLGDDNETHELKAKDIAVLVRSASQGQRVKAALATYGLAASFVDKKVSVYETDEAKLLYALLSAILNEDSRTVRALMLTPLFGCTAEQVSDDHVVMQIGRELGSFASLYDKKDGFAVMFYRVMRHFQLAGRLLAASDGKRKLSNFIQLFECLQAALQEQSLSLFGLCDWLAQRIHFSGDESELRLEDENAITIMTMHSAKGLEFPVVCLPFFDYATGNRGVKHVVVSHQDEQATLGLLKHQPLIAKAAREEHAEQARLAYVALTRAKYHNIIVLNPKSKVASGNMYQTLLDTLPNAESITAADFTTWVEMPDDVDKVNYQERLDKAKNAVDYQPKIPQKTHHSRWLLESFSRLQDHHHPVRNRSDTTLADDTPLLQFPKGPKAGNALHAMYEHYMTTRRHDTAFIVEIRKQYQRYLRQSPDDTVITALADNVVQTTRLPLAELGFCLDDVAIAAQSIEMKFFMHLTPKQRQQWYRDFGYHTGLESEGYVHGYIDYCFAHHGRFYVLDYKSNYLGQSLADYTQAAMADEMQTESYHLQAKIYTVALCRHLMITTSESYEQRIGGYVYLFVRGMNDLPETAGNGVYYHRFTWQEIAPLVV